MKGELKFEDNRYTKILDYQNFYNITDFNYNIRGIIIS